MKKYYIILAVMIIIAIVFFMRNHDDLQYSKGSFICRKCGARKSFVKHWYSKEKITIYDTPASIEVKRLFPKHIDHDWLQVSGIGKPWFKYGRAWDGNWRGAETFNTIVNASISDNQKRECLNKFYALENKPWIKTKDMKLLKEHEDMRDNELAELKNEIDISLKTFSAPEEAAYEALIWVPSCGQVSPKAVLNDCVHKNVSKYDTIGFFREKHRYCEFDMNDDGEKEYFFELNEYMDKTCGHVQIEGNSGGCKWAIIQKTPKGRYIIRHIEGYGGWPTIYASKTNGWHDFVIAVKGGVGDDGVWRGCATKFIWNGNSYVPDTPMSIRMDEQYDDWGKFIKKAKLSGVKEIGPSRP